MREFKTVFRGFHKEEVTEAFEKLEKEVKSALKTLREKEIQIEKLRVENESLRMQIEVTKKIYEIHKMNR